MDVFGAVLLVPGMLLTFLSVTMLQSNPGLLVAGSFAVGVILLVLFVRHERAVEQPLVAFGIFCDRHFVVNLICLFISFVANVVYELMTPFYLQDARGFDPGLSGLNFCVIRSHWLRGAHVRGVGVVQRRLVSHWDAGDGRLHSLDPVLPGPGVVWHVDFPVAQQFAHHGVGAH